MAAGLEGPQCSLFPLQQIIGLSLLLLGGILIDMRCTHSTDERWHFTTAMQHRDAGSLPVYESMLFPPCITLYMKM